MAGPRRRHPDPLPPAPGAIVLDGANVIASAVPRALERLDLVCNWCHAWRPDLPVMVFIDRGTALHCRPAVQDVLRARCADTTVGRPRYAVCPAGDVADFHVLTYAQQHRALVVSNDRYFDFDELRRNVVTVQFTIRGNRLDVFEEATWFRWPGTAVRVPMAALRELDRPA